MLHNLRCISKIMPPSKHTAAHVLPRQKMPTASFAKDAKSNLKPTKYNHISIRKRLIDT